MDLSLNSDGSYQLDRVCESRSPQLNAPRKIQHTLPSYLPFDDKNIQILKIKNSLGMTLPNLILRSGEVYDGYDGKRLVYEVGCNTIIYLFVKPGHRDHYCFFCQSLDQFTFDITTRSVAAKVVRATAPLKTIVKYEMYFMLGLLSVISIPILIVIVGTDMTVSGILAKKKLNAAKNLSEDLLTENKNIRNYAPTLNSKIEELFISQTKLDTSNFREQLPETIIKDEKTQAQLAGVLVGKATLAPKAFTFWGAISTILLSAVVKSVTKAPAAYATNLKDKYRPLLDDINSIDWDNPTSASQAASKLRQLFVDSGVEISDAEALLILREITSNPEKLETSLRKLNKSFREFEVALID